MENKNKSILILQDEAISNEPYGVVIIDNNITNVNELELKITNVIHNYYNNFEEINETKGINSVFEAVCNFLEKEKGCELVCEIETIII